MLSPRTNVLMGDFIVVDHNYPDDNETVLTDLQTIEYVVGQRNLFPAVSEVLDDSGHDSDEALARESSSGVGTKPASPSRQCTDDTTATTATVTTETPTTAAANIHTESNPLSSLKPSWIIRTPLDTINSNNEFSGPHQERREGMDKDIKKSKNDERIGSAPRVDGQYCWMEEALSDINPLPTPSPRPPQLELQYDSNGRVLKSSFLLNRSDARVGAFAQAGPAPFDVRTNGLPRGDISSGDQDPGAATSTTPEAADIGSDIESNHIQDAVVSRAVKEDIQNPPWWRSKPFLCSVAALMLVVIAVAVAIPFVLSEGGTEQEALPAVGSQESEVEEGFDLSLVPGIFDSTILALNDTFSAQYQAFYWISKDPNWDFFEDWRKNQRFALVCIHHSFEVRLGYDHKYLERIKYDSHECDWEPRYDHCPNGDGVVTRLGEILNPSEGTFPPELALLSDLEVVDFQQKQFRSLESIFPLNAATKLPLLREMRFKDAPLSAGAIPSTIGLFTSLTLLDLSENHLTSTIPTELGLLSNLTTLILSDNNLSGTIPEEIKMLPLLSTLNLDKNPLLPT